MRKEKLLSSIILEAERVLVSLPKIIAGRIYADYMSYRLYVLLDMFFIQSAAVIYLAR